MDWSVLVTARAFWVSGGAAIEALNMAGCQVVRSPVAGPVHEDDLIRQICDARADGVVASSDPYSERLFAACPTLKVVSRCGVGYDSVDVEAATAAGVQVTTTPGAMTEAVADYTLGLMLCGARSIVAGDALMRAGGWGEYPGALLAGKTLGMIGYGAIARGVARRAAAFDMKLVAFDPVIEQTGIYIATGCPPVLLTDLETLLRTSDFVSLHAPAMSQTRNMIDSTRLSMMKPTAWLINTARGSLVLEADLIRALESGTIAGAAIDVFSSEPLPADHPLRRAPRCIITPHNAFNAIESVELMSIRAAENIIEAMHGRIPPGLLNLGVVTSPQLRTPIASV